MLAVKKSHKKKKEKKALSSGPRTCARLASGRLFLWQHEHRSKTSSWMYWSSSRGPSAMAWVMPFYDIFVRNYRVKQDTWQIGHMPWPPMQNRRGFWKEKKVGKCEKEPPYHPPPRTWDIINWLPSNLSLHCPGASPATELMMMASKCPRGARKSVFEKGWGGPFSSTWNLLPRPPP